MTAAVPASSSSRGYINEKIKVEGLKRKKRRMRLKAKNQNEIAIEKFIMQSSKSAKYAKTIVRKRETSASADPTKKLEGAMATAASNMGQTSGLAGSATKPMGGNNSSQAVTNAAGFASANASSSVGGAAGSQGAAVNDSSSNRP